MLVTYNLILTPVFDLTSSECNIQSRGVLLGPAFVPDFIFPVAHACWFQGRQAPLLKRSRATGVLSVAASPRVGCEHFWGWHWEKYEASSRHALILTC